MKDAYLGQPARRVEQLHTHAPDRGQVQLHGMPLWRQRTRQRLPANYPVFGGEALAQEGLTRTRLAHQHHRQRHRLLVPHPSTRQR